VGDAGVPFCFCVVGAVLGVVAGAVLGVVAGAVLGVVAGAVLGVVAEAAIAVFEGAVHGRAHVIGSLANTEIIPMTTCWPPPTGI
jgi:hypothetical protein